MEFYLQFPSAMFVVLTADQFIAGIIKITDHFTFTSANVINCITCALCKKLYIGITGRRLKKRFREHLFYVEKDDKNASKQVTRHLNLPNHSKQHIAVCAFCYIKEAWKAAKLQSRGKIILFFKSALLILWQQLMPFIQLLYSVVFHMTMQPTNSIAPPFLNHTQPTIPQFAPMKG